MSVDRQAIQTGWFKLDSQERTYCPLVLNQSFGHVMEALKRLFSRCWTFENGTYAHLLQHRENNAPADDKPSQNGWDYDSNCRRIEPIVPFDPTTFDRNQLWNIDEMGQIPQRSQEQGHDRSAHPSVSWAANGQLAEHFCCRSLAG